VTIPRPYAHTLEDRSFVHQPTVIRGNKPVTIGHSYSLLAFLPEREIDPAYEHWIFPLSIERIAGHQKAIEVAQEQFHWLFDQDESDFKDQLCVAVGDTAYSTAEFTSPLSQYTKLVFIARLRSNRTLYKPDDTRWTEQKRLQGHPTWYGEAVPISDKNTWLVPDETLSVLWTTKLGKTYTVTISARNDLLMRGKRDAPMHDKPLKLVRIKVTDKKGKAVYVNPVYLGVFGKHRNELTLEDIYENFKQRFDLEHFFRFGKQRLLLANSQSPVVENEENWCNIVTLAYQQLFLARKAADRVRRPWESKKKTPMTAIGATKSPGETQRDFGRIIQEIGTPAKPPKTRNKPNGRPEGFKPKPRVRFKVVKKTKKLSNSHKNLVSILTFFLAALCWGKYFV